MILLDKTNLTKSFKGITSPDGQRSHQLAVEWLYIVP